MTCDRCTAAIPPGAYFCPACGAPGSPVSGLPASWPRAAIGSGSGSADPLLTAELLAYTDEIRPGSTADTRSYYLEKWRPILEGGGRNAGTNFAALLVAPLWCAYRKLYLLALGLILAELFVSGALVVLAAALGIVEDAGAARAVAYLAVPLVRGPFSVVANRVYLRRALRVVSRVRERQASLPDRIDALRRRGGTNEVAVGILIALNILATVALVVARFSARS